MSDPSSASGGRRGTSGPDRLEELDVDTCLGLLSRRHLGRVAVDDGDGPVVLPVNYLLDRGSVVFRTDVGTKLDAAVRGARVAFEVDEVDEATRSGWSVVVRGTVEEIADPGELARLRLQPLQPFAGGERERFVRVLSTAISGRRIPIPDEVPTGWFETGGLGHPYRGADADDLGFS